jgi:hypothetical protein
MNFRRGGDLRKDRAPQAARQRSFSSAAEPCRIVNPAVYVAFSQIIKQIQKFET